MPTTLSELSVKSLLLRFQIRGQPLATGTGFIVESPRGAVLITNRHNFTGRHNETGAALSANGAIPDEVVIVHNRAGRLGVWIERTEHLLDSGVPRWHEHPTLGAKGDFGALPLSQLDDVQVYPYTLGVGEVLISYGPADVVSVIGFPFGLQAGGSLGIWATGFVASEPHIDYSGLPVFLIDCRGRPGQSGSPVVAYRSGGMVAIEGGATTVYNGPVHRFLGIYSGRINDQSDLGLVWKASALQQLIGSIK